MKLLITIPILVACLSLSGLHAKNDDWLVGSYENMNLQFEVPPDWDYEIFDEGDGLEATSKDGSVVMVITAFKDPDADTADVFEEMIDELELESEGEFEEIDDFNGMYAILGYGAAVVDEEEVGMMLLAASHKNFHYVAYVFSSVEGFEKHSKTMEDILSSIKPLKP